MLTTELITRDSRWLPEIKQLFKTAFPFYEQIPMPFLLWRLKRPNVELLGFTDDGQLVGASYTISRRQQTYVLYLAVTEKVRSRGYGSQILAAIKARYVNQQIMLSIEPVTPDAPNLEQRQKRRQFYYKNGFRSTHIMLTEMGDDYELLTCSGSVKQSDYLALIKRFNGIVFHAISRTKTRSI